MPRAGYVSELFRVAIQPVRLFRGDQQHYGGAAHQYGCDAASRRIRAPLRPAAQSVQGHQVSVGGSGQRSDEASEQ